MGLGKTVSALTVIKYFLESCLVYRVLVIAPYKVSKTVWPNEINKWRHTYKLDYKVLTGLSAKKRREAALQFNDIHIINRENVQWLVDLWKGDWPYDFIIIDESSSFKSHKAKRFKKLKRILGRVSNIILMTGTPSSKKLLDLWSQIYLLDYGERLGRTYTKYQKSFFEPDHMGYHWELKEGSDNKIHALIGDLCLAMDEEDYVDLPDRLYNQIELELPANVRKQYRELEREFLITIDSEDFEAKNKGVLTGKLCQFANGALYKEKSTEFVEVHNEKLDMTEELVESLQGESLLIAYEFKSDLVRLKKRFPQAVVMTNKNVSEVEDLWNRKKIQLVLMYAGDAYGQNLQDGGHHQLWFSPPWSNERWRQWNKRLHRGTQGYPVTIHSLVMVGTVDMTKVLSVEGKFKTERAMLDYLKQDIKRRLTL